MRHPSAPNGPRPRNRGAIRTHLGRKRVGPRSRNGGQDGVVRMQSPARRRDEDLFDRLFGVFQSAFDAAADRTVSAMDRALDAACDTLVTAGEFTADGAERLRDFVRRDVLHRQQPTLTFRTGDITSAGTFTCETCGWSLQTERTTLLPPCPRCAETTFRKLA